MSVTDIRYIFKFDGGEQLDIPLQFEDDAFDLVKKGAYNKEPYHSEYPKCPHCPYVDDQDYECPLINPLLYFIRVFDKYFSYDNVFVTVEFKDRTVTSATSIQKGFSSLMGLIIPTCGCPHTMYLRPMARFHLPFSNTIETMYRRFSMFCASEFLTCKEGGTIQVELNKLNELNNNIHNINHNICDYLRDTCKKDSFVNAVTILDMFLVSMEVTINKEFHELRKIFGFQR